MIDLLLAIACSAMISVIMRIGEKYVRNEMAMFLSNYVVCVLTALLYVDRSKVVPQESVPLLLFLGIVTGALYLVSFVLLKFNMRHNGIVLASTFMKLGVLVPTLLAVLVFRETPTWLQIAGIVLALTAIVIIHFEKDALSEGNKKIWLLILLLFGGMGDAMSTVFERIGDPAGKDWFLVLTFGTSLVFSAAAVVIGKEKISGKDLLFGVLIGVPNYFSARFLLRALGSIDAVIVYPTYSTATMIAIAVVGVLVFGEKISRKKAVALGMIVLALCLLNL